MSRPRASRQAWLVLGGALATAIVLAFLAYVLLVPQAGSFSAQPSRPQASQSLRPSTYEQSRSWFGPWQSASADSSDKSSLVMLMTTSHLDVSSWIVAANESWQPAQPQEIIAARDGKTVTLQLMGSQQVNRLRLGQPFMLQVRPDAVYAVIAGPDRNDSSSFTIVTTTPEWAFAHGHRR